MSNLLDLLGRSSSGFTQDPRFAAITGELPEVYTSPPAAAPPPPPPDPVALAHAEGYAAGLAEARAEAAAQVAAGEQARTRFGFSFARLDAELAEALSLRLLETVVVLCEKTLQPLALDRAALTERVRSAAAMFVRADDERVIRLNPEDLEAVRPGLPEDWVFLADPALEPGALRVETASGGVEDGPAQWRQAIAEALDPVLGNSPHA